MPNGTIRMPTEREINMLAAHYVEMYRIEDEYADYIATNSAVIVVENYMTDSPIYAGDLMIVVPPGSADLTDTFYYNQKTETLKKA